MKTEKLEQFGIILAIGLGLIGAGSVIFYLFTAQDYDCSFIHNGYTFPTMCSAVRNYSVNKGLTYQYYNYTPISLTTTTLSSTTNYLCPDCPPCLQITTTTTTTPPTPNEVNTQGGKYYDWKPSKIDVKYQKCVPFENVTYPTYYEVRTNNNTNMTYINKTQMKTIRGGCIMVPVGCCSPDMGGHIAPINAKYYPKFYNEELGNCSLYPVVCRPGYKENVRVKADCLDGICQIVNKW